ncbi:hypothetical protein [Rhodanobacter geophilus]|uniref:Uncharacterized protein n=1 Tax=Rhodanobacter geophilus TaxID=3162488 RepID=A0ABV3QKX3_9GAMM
MPIHVRDPMEHDPQWRDRKKKNLPPELLKIVEILHAELRDHLKPGAPAGIILQVAVAVVRAQQVIAGDKGKAAVMKRHAAPGGSHDLAGAVRAEWASGKYKSRDVCADQVHVKIGLSYKAARNALIGTQKATRRG